MMFISETESPYSVHSATVSELVLCHAGQTTFISWRTSSSEFKEAALTINKQNPDQHKDVLFTKVAGGDVFLVAGIPDGRFKALFYLDVVILLIFSVEIGDGGMYQLGRRDEGSRVWKNASVELVVSPQSTQGKGGDPAYILQSGEGWYAGYSPATVGPRVGS